jgi:hypothetical protein
MIRFPDLREVRYENGGTLRAWTCPRCATKGAARTIGMAQRMYRLHIDTEECRRVAARRGADDDG